MNSTLTYLDFAEFYNNLNNHISPNKIFPFMLEPLLDKEIIIAGRQTKGNNSFFTINPKLAPENPKIKHINLNKKCGVNQS